MGSFAVPPDYGVAFVAEGQYGNVRVTGGSVIITRAWRLV